MLEINDLAKRYGTRHRARRGHLHGQPGPHRRVPRPQRRRQDHHDARASSAWPARIAARSAGAGAPVDRDARLRFGYMPEQRGLYPRMRVAEQLSYFAQQHGLRGKAANAAANRWLERMGLADRAKSKLEELSHGNQQRVQLATALVHDPELLVLDEPFSGLDPIGIATMTEVIRERAAAGVGVVFSSHQLDLVEDVCEDVVIIARGRIVAAGGIEELKTASGRQHLEVEVVGSDGTWLDGQRRPDRPRALERRGQAAGRPRGRPRRAARAARAGRARCARFAYQPPKLSELFMEAVASNGGRDGGGPMSRWRSIWLVARREILERGRSRGFILSVLFTTAIVIGSFVLTGILLGDATPRSRSVSSSAAPAGLETTLAGRVERVRQDPGPDRLPGPHRRRGGRSPRTRSRPSSTCPRTCPPRARSSTSRTPTRSSRASSGRASSACARTSCWRRATSTRRPSRRRTSPRRPSSSTRRPTPTRRASCSPTSARS